MRVARDDVWAKAQKLAGVRTILGVPMLREGTPIGVMALARTEAQPFTDKQIELVENFANQAVIAIENTRLLNELRQRTTDLTESLEQQTATSHVLSIISSSPAELEPVFQAILANATRLCDAKFGTLGLCDGEAFRKYIQTGRDCAWLAPRAADRPRAPAVQSCCGRSHVRVSETLRVQGQRSTLAREGACKDRPLH
jgi:transcriptional regulator with GAF, ATPase, and Fis domain